MYSKYPFGVELYPFSTHHTQTQSESNCINQLARKPQKKYLETENLTACRQYCRGPTPNHASGNTESPRSVVAAYTTKRYKKCTLSLWAIRGRLCRFGSDLPFFFLYPSCIPALRHSMALQNSEQFSSTQLKTHHSSD